MYKDSFLTVKNCTIVFLQMNYVMAENASENAYLSVLCHIPGLCSMRNSACRMTENSVWYSSKACFIL